MLDKMERRDLDQAASDAAAVYAAYSAARAAFANVRLSGERMESGRPAYICIMELEWDRGDLEKLEAALHACKVVDRDAIGWVRRAAHEVKEEISRLQTAMAEARKGRAA